MKWIAGYEGRYKVDTSGNVYSFIANGYKGKAFKMKLRIDKYGYKKIWLFGDNKSKPLFVHRLVAMAYLPNPKNKPQVNHINGIKTDNSLSNLEWVTGRENSRHAVATGLQTNNHSRKFSHDDIVQIKSIHANGFSFRKIAKIYKVQHQTIGNIIKGISYKDIT